MQTKLNVITLSILASLVVTGCSRGMKSRYVNPQAQNESLESGTPDVNPHSGEPNEDTPLQPADPVAVEPTPETNEPNKHSQAGGGATETPPKEEKPVVTTPPETKQPETKPPVTTPPATKPPETKTPVVTKPPEKKPATPVVKKPTPPVAPENPVVALFEFFPLLWEKTVIASKGWTQIIYNVIKKEESYLLGQNVADDIEIFCPTYRKLNEQQRLNFWGQFFAALAYHESGWSPVSRMVEANFTSKDSVTKMPVVSEGLLQLSYQDEPSYRIDCGFDWNKDKNLAAKDPKKTILDPQKNLRCGIKIMSIQLKKYRAITMSSNVYWAVLKTDGKYSKIPQIARSTRSLKICQN